MVPVNAESGRLKVIFTHYPILGWIVTVAVAVLAVTVFAAAHVTRGDGNRLATQATRLGWLFLPGLILRPPLMLFGLIASYFVFLAGIGLFSEVWLPQMRDAGASGGLGPIGFLALLTLYVMIAYGLMNASFNLIDLLPSAVLDWIGGRGGAGDEGGERVGGAAAGAISRVTLLPDPGPGGKLNTDLEGRDDKADEAAIFAGIQGTVGCPAVAAGCDA